MKRKFTAPAKINLCLHVLGKRPDGYHELAMLMQRVGLFDQLEISLEDRPGVRVFCDGMDLGPGEENIAAAAARRMLALTEGNPGVHIELQKEIPVAAGLGGGSSDAAAVLQGLNDMLDLGLSQERLMSEGLTLGADVPFFLFRRPAWATGIGEHLQQVRGLPSLWYVLVNPGVAVSTAWVYRNLGLTSKREGIKLPAFCGAVDEVVALLHNDLEAVTIRRCPAVDEAKELLCSYGALGALMSGSGPTVFGVFADEAGARYAASAINGNRGWWSCAVRPLDRAGELNPEKRKKV